MKRSHVHAQATKATLSTVLAIAVLLLGASHTAHAQTVTTILNFPNAEQAPLGVIAQGRDGEYYGLTQSGGAIYKVTASGTFTLLYTIPASQGQGCNGLVLGTDGNFYGTCFSGGDNGNSTGSFFQVTPAGTFTVLHFFDGNHALTTDGCNPVGMPVQASDGNFYGTAEGCGANNAGMAYKITPAGVFRAIHAFTGTDGNVPQGTLVQGSDGNLWGTAALGGTTGSGTVFKMTAAGVTALVYMFNACGNGTTGCNPGAGLVQGTDGNFYGVAEKGGTNNQGVVFKVTPGGVYTVLHSFNLTVDNGAYPQLPLTSGTDGNFYGVASGCLGGGCGQADIFKITSKGVFTDLHNFPNAGGNNNSLPLSPLLLATSGTFYSTTEQDGSNTGSNTGIFFSLVDGQTAFVLLQQTSGTVGSTVGVLGQGFSSSSVVKFNGVAATKVTLTGTTFLTATVPAGASDGFVTVTTGTTTLTSRQMFTVHNSWASGKAMPTAVAGAASASIGGKVYVVGGFRTQGAAPVNNNQIYNPTTKVWTTGAAIPTPVYAAASATVSGLFYVIGGYEGASGTPSNLVQIYNPAKNTWTTGGAMPTARGSSAAALDANAIYVIGGNGATLRLNNVEKYVPATNTWTVEAPLLLGKSEPAAGLLGTMIVAADGYGASGDTGDNEAYNVSGNTWSSSTVNPNPRNASCYGALTGQLYVAGGLNNGNPQAATTVNESFSVSTHKWTTQRAMPSAAVWPASAVGNGQLYCIGGQASFQGAVVANVQIYQP
jgi:uncharacterized repeat protein (TIGR03803 family)